MIEVDGATIGSQRRVVDDFEEKGQVRGAAVDTLVVHFDAFGGAAARVGAPGRLENRLRRAVHTRASLEQGLRAAKKMTALSLLLLLISLLLQLQSRLLLLRDVFGVVRSCPPDARSSSGGEPRRRWLIVRALPRSDDAGMAFGS